MSYSFAITAVTKDEAGVRVEEQLELVVGSQPVHARDRQAAQDVAEAFIDMLPEPSDGERVAVSVWGSLSYRADDTFTSASVGVTATIITT